MLSPVCNLILLYVIPEFHSAWPHTDETLGKNLNLPVVSLVKNVFVKRYAIGCFMTYFSPCPPAPNITKLWYLYWKYTHSSWTLTQLITRKREIKQMAFLFYLICVLVCIQLKPDRIFQQQSLITKDWWLAFFFLYHLTDDVQSFFQWGRSLPLIAASHQI